jgi:hypothetical protein
MDSNGGAGMLIEDSHHIGLLNSELIGGTQFNRTAPVYDQVSQLYGLHVENSENIVIENNYVHDIKAAAFYFNAVDLLTLRGNNADWLDSDGYKFSVINNALIENNTGMQNIYSSPSSHVDFMQVQGTMNDSIFRGNYALMNTRSFQ